MTKKIWLDCDAGDDIDDALTIGLAAKLPGCELVGISTVYRKSELRARLCKKILSLYGFSVPVYAGLNMPMGESAGAVEFTQYDEGLLDKRYAADNGSNEREAIDALVRAVEQYGEKLTVVAIGPFTNIAAAYQAAPGIMKRANVVMMGGSAARPWCEWNIACDLVASEVLFHSDMDVTAIGFNVTGQSDIGKSMYEYLQNCESDAGGLYLRQLTARWTAYAGRYPMLHDPYTLISVFLPELFIWEEEELFLETRGTCAKGMTFRKRDINPYGLWKGPGKRMRYAAAARHDILIEKIIHIIFDQGEKLI